MEIKSITKFVTEYVVIEESEYDDEEDSCWWCGNSAGVDTITFLNTYLIKFAWKVYLP